jgi:hypothetical protein
MVTPLLEQQDQHTSLPPLGSAEMHGSGPQSWHSLAVVPDARRSGGTETVPPPPVEHVLCACAGALFQRMIPEASARLRPRATRAMAPAC